MKKIIIPVFAMGLFLFAGCSATKPSDVVLNAAEAAKDGDEGALEKYYTAKTVEMINEVKELTKNLPDAKDPVAKNFNQGEMEIVKEEIKDDVAYVTVRYKMEENKEVVGSHVEYIFTLRKEDGKWKIDLEKELSMSLQMFRLLNQAGGFLEQLKQFAQ